MWAAPAPAASPALPSLLCSLQPAQLCPVQLPQVLQPLSGAFPRNLWLLLLLLRPVCSFSFWLGGQCKCQPLLSLGLPQLCLCSLPPSQLPLLSPGWSEPGNAVCSPWAVKQGRCGHWPLPDDSLTGPAGLSLWLKALRLCSWCQVSVAVMGTVPFLPQRWPCPGVSLKLSSVLVCGQTTSCYPRGNAAFQTPVTTGPGLSRGAVFSLSVGICLEQLECCSEQ